MGHIDSIERLGERSYLINLHQDSITTLLSDASFQEFHIGYKQVIPNQLTTVADALRKFSPAVPIVLGHTVLDRINRILGNQTLEVGYLLVA